MKTKILFSLIILTFLFSDSCRKGEDYDLLKTVFIEDPYNPGLPIYSEWGYNSFGAYFDRKPFVSTQNELPAKITVYNDTVHFMLRGEKDYEKISLQFVLTGYSPDSFFDLTEFSGTVFDLSEDGYFINLKMNEDEIQPEIIEGELEFKKVRILYVDEEATKTILSGYFQLKIILDNEPFAIHNGRFDVGVGYSNFYKF